MKNPDNASRKFKRLDVRVMLSRGEEPFGAIRAQVQTLRPNEGLSVVAPFLPSPLIEKLGNEGFQSRVEHLPGGPWVTHFWRD